MIAHIRKGDEVIVRSGKDVGRKGKVLRVLPVRRRAYVEGISVVKKHRRPSGDKPGGIEQTEASILLCKIALIDPKDGKATRVGIETLKDGKKVRVARRSGEHIL